MHFLVYIIRGLAIRIKQKNWRCIMRLGNSFRKLTAALHNSIKRFPATLILTTIFTILLIYITENNELRNTDMLKTLTRINMAVALGVPISLIIKFILELKPNIKPILKIFAYVFLVLFIILYYSFFIPDFNMVTIIRYTALTFSFYFLAIITPFLGKKPGLELYVIKLLLRFFTTVVYSIVLQLGLSAILFTLDKLLGIKIYENLYLYIGFIICGVFAPTFFLGGVPRIEDELQAVEYPNILKILFLYIIMPLLSVYTLILYLYFAKILITLKWPEGMVGNLVLWYSVISVWIIFLIFPLKDENRWAKTFFRWFPKIILPLIVLMFISLGIRLNAYGVTENRYFVIALGIWVLLTMLYWSVSKEYYNKLLLIGFSIIAFLSVVGPWNAFSISIGSQNKRFENLLNKYEMLENQSIKASSNVSNEHKKEITSILVYFENHHSFSKVKYLPKNFVIADMKKTFGFDYSYNYYDNNEIKYFSYTLEAINVPISTSEYDYLLYFRYPSNNQLQKNAEISVEYSNSNQSVIINYKGQEIYNKSLRDFGEKLYENIGDAPYKGLSQDIMTYVDENPNIKVKFLFSNINGNKTSSDKKIEINEMEFDLFIDVKSR